MVGRGSDGFDASCALMLRWGIKKGNFGWFFELFLHLALRAAGEKVAVCATRGELQRDKKKVKEMNMGYQLERLKKGDGCAAVGEERLRSEIERLVRQDGPRFARLWAYYQNPLKVCAVGAGEGGAERPYRQAQEWGLPSRITGLRSGREMFIGEQVDGVARKEVVIENDIGWRIETMVDYLFGKPLVISSAAPDEKRRELIGALARAIVARNGGILFLQQLALMGAVYGFVDVLVKVETCAGEIAREMPAEGSLEAGACGTQDLGEPPASGGGGSVGEGSATAVGSALVAGETSPAASADGEDSPAADDQAEKGASHNSLEALVERLARMIRLEIVEPARALPILSCDDYRVVEAYGQCYRVQKTEPISRRHDAAAKGRWWERIWKSVSADRARESENSVLMTEIISATRWQRYENEVLVAEGENSLGEIPLVHIQNTALPFEYGGASDVEPLIPLQDELNTRLSDRASRITLQSFKMYLGKGSTISRSFRWGQGGCGPATIRMRM